ncbi:MAG TPA: ABC transporter ATP-binding protein [Acidimicrobiales bacterium]
MAAIRVRDLRKSYGALEAVRGVDFDVGEGEVFGFLGPNGAGKTTIVEILEGYRQRSAGEVAVLGHDPAKGERALRERIGIVLQETGVERFLKVAEVLELYCGYYPRPRAVDELLALTGLEAKRNEVVKELSGGQRRRLDLALGLAGDPELVFLDEPTTGFDPTARRDAWDIIRNLRSLGKTIFLTTHYMDEAEHCDRIAIIDDGRLVVVDTPATLKAAMGMDRVELRTDDDEAVAKQVTKRFGVDATVNDGHVAILVDHGERFVPELCARLGVAIYSVNVVRPSLDDVFMAYTGRAIRDDGRAPRDGAPGA